MIILSVSATADVLLRSQLFQDDEEKKRHCVDWNSLLHLEAFKAPIYKSIHNLEFEIDPDMANYLNQSYAAEMVMKQYQTAAKDLVQGGKNNSIASSILGDLFKSRDKMMVFYSLGKRLGSRPRC